jgi:hypothetical protein
MTGDFTHRRRATKTFAIPVDVETLSSRNSVAWEKVTARQSLALPILRDGTAHQEGRGASAGLFHPHGGKTGGVEDIDGGYHPGRGAILEMN